jgi:hypothetical protein
MSLLKFLKVSVASILLEVAEKSCDGDERRFQVVRYRVGESFQFGVFGFQFCNQFFALKIGQFSFR